MIHVQVDGNPVHADVNAMRTMGDLIEFVKTTIDPDTMITSILFNGESLSELDWNTPLAQHRDRRLEVLTGTKQRYLAERFSAAQDIATQVITGFRQAADGYRVGNYAEGNQRLSSSVEDLLAFVNWLNAMLGLDEDRFASQYREFTSHVDVIREISEQLLQQQLYSAWWVLAEMITNKLIPELEAINQFTARLAAEFQR